MKRFLFLLLLGWATLNLSAQAHFEGTWKGTLTIGGLHSESGYPLEIYLVKEGNYLKGRSYIDTGEGKIIEMEIKGRMYEDRSFYLYEIDFFPSEEVPDHPAFKRKYQLLYNRSFQTTMEGFWQEIIDEPFEESRERGRVKLTKIKKKNKA